MTLEHIIDIIQGAGLDINKGIEYTGGEEMARKLAMEFVAMYPRRSAMIDELRPFLRLQA